ncbi:MAG TPA: response regulator [Thermodesulfobacteriota bacterium]|nr:response regulator [Deltaproteobacteria bacterium]HNR12681.1 response regulator [Thermodesulfobacteriota bacterium]HNU71852.1 response regulator [Thermodesulfobacteriota bacterium]HOC38899.1 response regulator [Thermodesulfobacteriota bacterium]HQO79182.1 response regulator [Thermodesulfobacteriota bacterium]
MSGLLLVEDNETFRMYLTEILRDHFPAMDIEEASDGSEARGAIDKHSPDLIFMDINLPGESGLELTRQIKARYPDVVVAILTAYDLPEYRAVASQAGADYFMVKGSAIIDDILDLIQKIAAEKNGGSERHWNA